MGQPGITVVGRVLPSLRAEKQIELVVAQSENVSDGKGMLPKDMKTLQGYGVDFFTGGNHTPKRTELATILNDNNEPVIGPANMHGCPGRGWKYTKSASGSVLVISILGETFSNHKPEIDNPLQTIDKILEENKDVPRAATVVNFHGDYSSEKVIFGYYLDGRVSAVIGDHWHVPTADALVLPKGTAHITDVGMCGVLHSSLGVKFDSVIPRWRDGIVNRNELETVGPLQFNAALIETDNQSGLAKKIIQIQKII